MSRAIPVLCYHRVAPGEKLDPALFAAHLDLLARSGLPGLTPADLNGAQRGWMLTFDDGFAEAWTLLAPLLAARGLRCVVFAIPSRAGEGEPRPQGAQAFDGSGADAQAAAAAAPGPHPAFLRWSELAALEASGVATVQSHSWSHAAGWVEDAVVGFNLGVAHWSLAQATGGDTRLGIPLYRRGSALAHRLYRDDPERREQCARWLEERGGATYLAERGARAVTRELRAVADARRWRGAWESEGEREARTLEEIARARQALEGRLGGARDELALPWGEHDGLTLDCARRAGVRRVYTLLRRPNPAGRIGWLVHRFEPRARDARWLASRLRIYGSTWAAALYGRASGRA